MIRNWKSKTEPMGSATLVAGPVGFSCFYNYGPWGSFGIHVSLRPLQVHVHLLWFIFSVLSAKEALLLVDCEEGYDG